MKPWAFSSFGYSSCKSKDASIVENCKNLKQFQNRLIETCRMSLSLPLYWTLGHWSKITKSSRNNINISSFNSKRSKFKNRTASLQKGNFNLRDHGRFENLHYEQISIIKTARLFIAKKVDSVFRSTWYKRNASDYK